MRTLSFRWLAVVVAVALVFAACGGDSASDESSIGSPEISVTTESPPGSTTASSAPTSPGALATIRVADVDFLTDRSEQLDVFHPQDDGPWPVVVVVHGGRQVRSEFTDLAEAMASSGAVVFNVDYLDRFPFVTAVEQVACAVRFARSSAPRFGGTPDRVVVFAHSIGAFIALNVALGGDEPRAGCVSGEGSPLPDAFVGYEGPYDLVERYHEGSGFDYRTMKEDEPDLWHSMNPYSGLGRHPDLIVRLIHGGYAADDRVFGPVAEAEAFRDVLIEAGYDAELIVVEGALHGSVYRKGEDAFATALRTVTELTGG